MEESNSNKGDLQGNVVRSSSLRPLKSTLAERSTPTMSPKTSPSFGRSNSGRSPRKEGRRSAFLSRCFSSSRVVHWLLLITLWTYGGFYIQSLWEDNDKHEGFINFSQEKGNNAVDSEQNHGMKLTSERKLFKAKAGSKKSHGVELTLKPENRDLALSIRENFSSNQHVSSSSRKGRRSERKSRRRNKVLEGTRTSDYGFQEEMPRSNATYGRLLGPFGSIEERILEWSPKERSGTCDYKEPFTKLVRSKKFVLILHELSMTGAPLSMLELATELLNCGASVQAVVLSRKGGLMPDLLRRKIKLIDDKAEHSFVAAMEADIVIAGSAVCASWIEGYLAYFPAGSNQITWWIMENRREYFNRSKLVLHRVKTIMFLSELQSKQWLSWCEEENIKLNTQVALIPLSVNDELAFAAGIPCSLNTPRFSPEKMMEKRQMLREAARKEMGLKENDMLVMALSSINAAKGQLLLVESAQIFIAEQSQTDIGIKSWLNTLPDTSTLTEKLKLRGFQQKLRRLSGYQQSDNMVDGLAKLASNKERQDQNLKILIGSVGSKSNKVFYVKEIIRFLSENPILSKSVLWTPATTSVASLYSAADVYVTNSQGIGETFGRVTIEAMAFGLPVLGTDAGGTREIVDNNITGLLHPVGRPGREILAENIKFLLKNSTFRKQMGIKGREKVERFYLKRHMYKLLFEVLSKSMQID
ncbi:hypothetical protein V2J09_004619 [Rumex salicifolius]